MRVIALALLLALGAAARAQEGADEGPATPVPPPTAPPPIDNESPPLVPPGQPPCCDEPPPPAVAAPQRNRILVELTLGPTYRYLARESFFAGAASLLVGAQDARWGGGGLFTLAVGRTRYGLSYQQLSFGPAFEIVKGDRLRIGIGVASGFIVVQRVTRSGSLDAIYFGPFVGASYDLWKSGSSALFVVAKGSVDYFMASDDTYPLSPALQISLGYRF